ncbi:MAG: hydantoinase/oxoprolinase family protein [Streptosporangiales bacterium]|nr:hydantoinase/oxoprolinase family protein [Streptosporangiales bacterium]
MRIGVECGGTFTDLVVLDDAGELRATTKVFSTPGDPAQAVLDALGELDVALLDDAALLHGSTVATNALLERKGARLGLLVTRGFRDVLFLQRQDRTRMYDLQYQKPAALVDRECIAEVDERMAADGAVVDPLDEESVRAAVERLRAAGVTVAAVCLLHSYQNPAHEQRVAELVQELAPDLPVSVSSAVAREFREYERMSTTAVDGFLRPVVARYLERLGQHCAGRGIESVQVMQSNGGAVPTHVVAARPITMLLSGPAAGVSGAIAVAEAAGLDDIVTIDMGGTSTDVALVTGGEPMVTAEAVIDGLPVRTPMVDITTVGAGGGSIVSLDSGGLLRVGPTSAGAKPGPACYDRGGTEPTVTDANVVCGVLPADSKLGGRWQLDVDAARRAFEPIAAELGQSVSQVVEAAVQLANVAMSGAIRIASVERGYAVEHHTLLAYGGAGPLHAASVAAELGIRRVLVPPYPGLASAYGLLASPFRREFSRTSVVEATRLTDAEVKGLVDVLTDTARAELGDHGIDLSDARFAASVDIRYVGQGFEVNVPLPATDDGCVARLLADFHQLHERRFGHSDQNNAVQLVTFRVAVTKPRPVVRLPRVDAQPGGAPATSSVVIGGEQVVAQSWQRPQLPPDTPVAGPAIVTDDTSTTFVPPGWRATVDPATTNLILEHS